MTQTTLKKPIFCNDCKHFKEDGENCCDDLTVGISDIPLKDCSGYEEKMNDESKEFHREEDLAEKQDEYYQDWKKDNLDELKRNFLEDNDDFDKYCRDEFKNKDK